MTLNGAPNPLCRCCGTNDADEDQEDGLCGDCAADPECSPVKHDRPDSATHPPSAVVVGTCGRELDVEMTGAPMEDVCEGDVIATPGATYGRCQTCGAERPVATLDPSDTGS